MTSRSDRASACASLRARLDRLEPEAGLALAAHESEHLAACPACRRAVAEADPSALFSLLTLERTSDAFWTGFETRVLAGVREERRAPSGFFALLRPRTLAVLASCAAMALAALLLLPARDAWRVGDTRMTAQGIRPARGASGLEAVSRDEGADAAERTARVDLASPLLPLRGDSPGDPPALESVSSSTARIISFRVDESARGASSGVPHPGEAPPASAALSGGTDVVLIVDQGIDI